MKKYLLLLLAASSLTQAATFNVSTTAELRAALSTAATNGDDDTINLADGTYKTTDDGGGTFKYVSNEANSLTLQGSGADNVILSGDEQHQILNIKSTVSIGTVYLQKLSFINGNEQSGHGGAINSYFNIEMKECNFTSNYAKESGGGVYVGTYMLVQSSIFKNNTSKSGGGFSSVGTEVIDSTFENNLAEGDYAKGGGFDSNGDTVVSNSIFRNNTVSSTYSGTGGGGGFSASGTVSVNDSKFYDNSVSVEVNYSFEDAKAKGGGFASHNSIGFTDVTNSIFIGNSLSTTGSSNPYSAGAGFYIRDRARVNNSFFSNNSAQTGSGFSCDSRYITDVSNSIFTNNIDENGGTIESQFITLSNSILINNSSGISILFGNSTILNSIFDNNGSEISGSGIVEKLENNYIDLSAVSVDFFAENNIFDSVFLGFIDEANGDYRLTLDSGLIDIGTTDIEGVTFPETDMDGNARISGGTIDIGPYEFNSTRPTINAVTYTGTAKEQNELTFTTDYTLTGGREMTEVLYDFMNDGNYTYLNTYTYNTAGTYTVNVKVTDSEGEFSTSSLEVTITELPWSEMTYEQKLIEAISPEYYDLLISEIDIEKSKSFSSGKHYVQNNLAEFSLVTEADKNTAFGEGTMHGIATGKQYVQDNLTEFSLVTEAAQATAVAASNTSGIATGKQYVQDNLTEFSLVTEAAQATAVASASTTGITDGENNVINDPVAYGLNIVVGLSKEGIAQLPTGWKMISIPEDVTDLSVFDGAKIVWFFNNETQAWTGYSSNTNTVQQMENNNIGIITSLSAGDGVFIEM
jgi:predicted outer membrane repeat protein